MSGRKVRGKDKLQEIRTQREQARGRKPLVFTGGPGIGKSSLLEELMARCVLLKTQGDGDVLVLRGEGRAREQRTAYYAFRQVFEELLRVPKAGSIREKTKAVEEQVALCNASMPTFTL